MLQADSENRAPLVQRRPGFAYTFYQSVIFSWLLSTVLTAMIACYVSNCVKCKKNNLEKQCVKQK
ncbi:hypothetical protein SAMN05192562_104198 [Kosakonia arachidis]|uniref:Uncharacterized protein n=1 Tax=Kosakonia arachidis TaxID=551989 RepID=A0A1I7CYS1_9ENTR|nr:hypothetical protein SAMN05192562_104198 [Kosakonia arachidis]